MPDMALISGAVASLKLAFDMTKTLGAIRDFSKLNETVIELQRLIMSAQSDALSAQSDQFSLLDRIRSLETEIAGLKAWDAEKKRYQLTEVAPRVFAYVLKPDAGGSEPSHWICAACYENGKKSILQGSDDVTFGWFHNCQTCKTEIKTGRSV
jgi:hypothetical protein